MTEEYDYLFKCIVVGDGGVGKTALTIRFSKGFFTEDYKMTIGVDFHVKTISIDTEQEGPIKVKLQIWDTGGQERFSSIRPMYYRGSLGGLLIFDLTSYESFEHLPQWIEEVRANVKSDIPLLLIGNKSDLIEQRAVSIEEINTFTKMFNLYYSETSAKTGEGVGDCFYILACLMVGSGVPEKLISQGIVFGPGQATSIPSVVSAPVLKPPEIKPEVAFTPPPSIKSAPKTEFIIPPVPEPVKTFEPEPEIDFAAPPVPERQPPIESIPLPPKPEKEPMIYFTPPPVPEKEPEIEFAAPPVPEPSTMLQSQPTITAPEQHLPPPPSIDEKKPTIIPSSKISIVSEAPVYKPKSIPFTSNVPLPAPPPQEFKPSDAEPESDSLVDYMPENILSKKELKKLEKEKKKVEKEKQLQEKREKAAKLKEEMQKVGKEKKKEEYETPSTPFIHPQPPITEKSKTVLPSLFETLSKKTESSTSSTDSYMPFISKEPSTVQESSKLRIIPNITDLNNAQSQISSGKPKLGQGSTIIPPREDKESKKGGMRICPQCGAMLSSEYAFCNKCGSKL